MEPPSLSPIDGAAKYTFSRRSRKKVIDTEGFQWGLNWTHIDEKDIRRQKFKYEYYKLVELENTKSV